MYDSLILVEYVNGTDPFYVEVATDQPCLVMYRSLGGDHGSLYPWLDSLGKCAATYLLRPSWGWPLRSTTA